MATIEPVITYPSPGGDKSHQKVILYTWTPVTSADTCKGVQSPAFADQSMQVIGTFGGTVTVQGSNNSTNGVNGDWSTLRDPFSNNLTFTADGLKAVMENSIWIRPSPGAGVTSVACSLASKR